MVGEDRTHRALAWIGLAALGTLVAGVVYLRPSLAPPVVATPSTRAGLAAPAGGWRLVSASFADASHGTVQFYSSGIAPATSFLTSDGGRTWYLAARAPRNGYAFAAFLDSTTLVAQTVSSLGPANAGPVQTRISDDGGRTWRQLTDPRRNPEAGSPGFLNSKHAWWIDRAPSSDPHTPVALWRTTDGGVTWQELWASGLPATGIPVQTVFTDPLHGVLVFTTRDGPGSALVTSDGGESWRAVDMPEVPLQRTRALSWVLLRHGHRMLSWLLTVPGSNPTAGGIPSSIDYLPYVSVSDDGGQTWSKPRPAPNIVQPGYIGLLPRVDQRGRLLLVDDRRLWISVDDGATWAARLMQAPADLRPATLVSAVRGALYAMAAPTGPISAGAGGTPLMLIRSSDCGAHWSVVGLPQPPPP